MSFTFKKIKNGFEIYDKNRLFGIIHEDEYYLMEKFNIIQNHLMSLRIFGGENIQPSSEVYNEWLKLDKDLIKDTINQYIENIFKNK